MISGPPKKRRRAAPGAARERRDAYLLAHTQIAAYELLSRTASAAGDSDTADLARAHLDEDRKCADEVAKHWDDFFQLTLAEWTETATPVRVT